MPCDRSGNRHSNSNSRNVKYPSNESFWFIQTHLWAWPLNLKFFKSNGHPFCNIHIDRKAIFVPIWSHYDLDLLTFRFQNLIRPSTQHLPSFLKFGANLTLSSKEIVVTNSVWTVGWKILNLNASGSCGQRHQLLSLSFVEPSRCFKYSHL